MKECKLLIDSHAHLQWEDFGSDIDEVVKNGSNVGVKVIINVGYDFKACKKTLELADRHDGLYAAIGIHPHNAKSLNKNILQSLRELSQHSKVVAIGEIGLDYFRNLSPREMQRNAFEAQINLADELNLPIVVHSRDAQSETLEILSKNKNKIKDGVMHCFSGSLETAERCLKLGLKISLAGPITFPNAYKLHDIVRKTSLDNILLETDCPWLAPQPKRGKRNEPAFLIYTANKISELKQIPLADVASITSQNTKRLFHIKIP